MIAKYRLLLIIFLIFIFLAACAESPVGYGITYLGNGNTSGILPSYDSICYSGDSLIVVGNSGMLVKSGYTFGGWNTKDDGSGKTYAPGDTILIGDTSIFLYALWIDNATLTYHVTYDGNGATGGQVPIDAGAYHGGDTVVILDNTSGLIRIGYAFSGWNTEADGTGDDLAALAQWPMPSQDFPLYATWSADKYFKSFSIGGYQATIDEVGKSILLHLPYSSDPSDLVADFTIAGARVAIGSTTQTTVVTHNDFSLPITYSVYGADDTKSDYKVMVEPGIVYAVGFSSNAAGKPVPGYWKDGSWNKLSTLSGGGGHASTITASSGDLYIGGYCVDSGGVTVPGYWKNEVWTPFPLPTNVDVNDSFSVSDIAIAGTDIYASCSGESSNIAYPGYWLNGTWVSLPNLGKNFGGNFVSSILLSGGHVYAAGSLDSGGVVTPGYWLDNAWNQVTADFDSWILDMVAVESDIYLAGESNNIDGYACPTLWKNGTIYKLSRLGAYPKGIATCIASYAGWVYVGGFYIGEASAWVPCIWKCRESAWRSDDWNQFPQLNDHYNAEVTSLYLSSGDVYAGGYSCDDTVTSIPGYWRNGVWHGLIPGYTSQGARVEGILVE